MKWIICGLGNPGGEYVHTRHNVGRIVLDAFRHDASLPEWEFKKTHNALTSMGAVDGVDVLLLEPETYMNDSGKSLTKLVKSKKQASQLVVVYDDIDLPLGTWKISWNRNSGGHNGVESITQTLKTKEFIRIRVGISPRNADGALKKSKGEEAVIKFVLGKFRDTEMSEVQKISKDISSALQTILRDGHEIAMNKYN